MLMNWLIAIGILVFAVGFVLLLIGMERQARYGYSIVFDIGGYMMATVIICAILVGAVYGAIYFVTSPPVK